jgi:hypothetical protein
MRINSRPVLLIVAALAGVPANASAQVPTAPESVTSAPFLIRRPPADLDVLTRLYNLSDWAGLQFRARDIICVVRRNASEVIEAEENRDYESCMTAASSGSTASGSAGGSTRLAGSEVPAAIDLQRNHVAVMWLGEDAFGKPQLMRAVVHRTSGQPYSLDLPGVSARPRDGELVELFLSRSPQGRVASLYTSTREDDPLLAALPAFIQALAGPLFTTIGSIAGNLPGMVRETVQVPPKPKLAATVKRVGLPFRRAAIRLQAVAREPLPTADFAMSAARLASSLTFGEVPHAPCARELAKSLADDLPLVTQGATCSAATAQPLNCLAAFDTVLTASFDAAVKSCEGGKPSRDALNALEKVDARFRGLVNDGTSTSAALDLTFKNRPPARFAFGAGSGVMTSASLTRSRVTTKDGVLVADPLDRVMTVAFVNWSPAGYDAADPRISPAERFRLFFGAALTPDFGPAFGINVLLVRGIGLTAGGGFLFGKGADAAEIGKEPALPDDPYKLVVARTVFVGISYNYK